MKVLISPVGPDARWRKRLRTTSREPVPNTESGAYGHWTDMDAMVFCYHAEERTVGLISLPHPSNQAPLMDLLHLLSCRLRRTIC